MCLARQSQHCRLAPLYLHLSLSHFPSALSVINLSSPIPSNSHSSFKHDRARPCFIIFHFLHISCQAQQMRRLCNSKASTTGFYHGLIKVSVLHSPSAFLCNAEAVGAAALPLCTGQATLSAVLSAWKASIKALRCFTFMVVSLANPFQTE